MKNPYLTYNVEITVRGIDETGDSTGELTVKLEGIPRASIMASDYPENIANLVKLLESYLE